MCKSSELVQSGGIELFDLIYNSKTKKVQIFDNLTEDIGKESYKVLNVESLLSMISSKDYNGKINSRKTMESLGNCYHIPNRGKTYETHEEYLLSILMYREKKSVWVDGLNEKGEPDGKFTWKPEKELIREKLGFEKTNDQTDKRTVSILSDNGNIIGCRTEKIQYNFETSQIEVLEVIDEYLYPEKK